MSLKCYPYFLMDRWPREGKWLDQGHTACKWPPKPCALTAMWYCCYTDRYSFSFSKSLWGYTPTCPQYLFEWYKYGDFMFSASLNFLLSFTTSYYLNKPTDNPKGFLNVKSGLLGFLLPFRDLHGTHHREAKPTDHCVAGAIGILPPALIITSHPMIE